MASVSFSPNLQTHVDVESCGVEANTVSEALNEVFSNYPELRSYVLDDQGAVRKHIAIFLNGESIHDRQNLTDSLPPDGELFIMQALTGG